MKDTYTYLNFLHGRYLPTPLNSYVKSDIVSFDTFTEVGINYLQNTCILRNNFMIITSSYLLSRPIQTNSIKPAQNKIAPQKSYIRPNNNPKHLYFTVHWSSMDTQSVQIEFIACQILTCRIVVVALLVIAATHVGKGLGKCDIGKLYSPLLVIRILLTSSFY